MKINDVAIVILSCDKFKVTWEPCIDHFFNAWPDCQYPVYLLNNYVSSEDNRVNDLLVGEDNNWSDTLKKGLLKIQQQRIFFIYDDSFITKFYLEDIKLIFNIAIQNDLPSVALRKRKYDKGEQFNEKLYKLGQTTKYRNSLYLNLFKKDLLLSLLKSGENAWQFEKDGNNRSKIFDFYSVYETELASAYHGIVKGKCLPETYHYLKENGYALHDNTFEVYNKFQVFNFQIYTKIFDLFHRFSHLFK
jgi:hypothetical protein